MYTVYASGYDFTQIYMNIWHLNDFDTNASLPHKAMQVHFSKENIGSCMSHKPSKPYMTCNTWLRIININIPPVLCLDTSVRTFGFTFITYKKVSIILLSFTPHYNEECSDTEHHTGHTVSWQAPASSFSSSACLNHTINVWNNFRCITNTIC